MPGTSLRVDEDGYVGEVVVEIVEVLVVDHCFMAFVFLRVVGSGSVVGDVGDYNDTGDFKLLDPGVVFFGSCCYDEIDAGEGVFWDSVGASGLLEYML